MSQIGVNDLKTNFEQGKPAVASEINNNFTVIKNAHNATDSDLTTLESTVTSNNNNAIKKDGSVASVALQSYATNTITNATNATPIVITTSAAHNKNTGDSVYIKEVEGNTAANGVFQVTKIDSTSFSLDDSVGNGSYTSGGTVVPLPTEDEQIPNKAYVDNGDTKNIIEIGSCSTASATAEKVVTLSGFTLTSGATIQVVFTNANTADVPTLNVNSTGAKAIYNEAGTAVSATNPAYFPAGSTVEFTYNGTNWVFKKRVIENYVNGTSWYRVYSDGWIEQGGRVSSGSGASTVTLLKSYINTNYNCQVTNAAIDGNPNPQFWSRSVTAKTATSFTTNQYSDLFTGYEWQTSGYIR